MRKTLLLAAVTAAMSLGVSAAHAQLLYSFETGDSPNGRDGFVNNGLQPTQTTTGATVGSDALELSTPAGGYTGSYTQADLPALLSNPGLSGFTADVTISPNDPAFGGTYSDMGMGLFIYNAGEGEYGDQFLAPTSDWVNVDLAPGTYTSLYVPLVGNNPDTGLPISYADLLADGWAVGGFNIVDSNSGAAETFYVDNIQAIVPEPASLGVLAGTGLLMLSRRRRSKI
ncbi:MAG: PEP-CTERM sorting domain-containing protein [Tepidisphaeraceae bacterium]|jgi:hypothetical protein